jgi:Na+/melibiose symporter-like transporter
VKNEEITKDYERRTKRNVARVISSVMTGFILLFTVGQWIQELFEGTLMQEWRLSTIGMAVYVVLITLGSSLGWWRENIGGTILVIAGLGMLSAMFIFLPPRDYLASLIFSLPFLLSGILYIMYWKESRSLKGKNRISRV